MKRLLALALILFVGSAAAMAQEYPALVYFSNGEGDTGSFSLVNNGRVNLTFDGRTQAWGTNDVGVVIFDNNYTRFNQDWQIKNNGDPHIVVLKDGSVIYGSVGYMQPGSQISIIAGGGTATYRADEVARIYFNAQELFKNARVHSDTELVLKSNSDSKSGNADQNKKRDDKQGGNRGGNNQAQQQAQRLGGGEALITFRNNSTTRGLIYDAQGNPLVLVLRDGRKLNMGDIYQINYFETVKRYSADNNLMRGVATFIYRNGGSTTGVVLDYKGQDEWELADGRRIPANQLARIVFR